MKFSNPPNTINLSQNWQNNIISLTNFFSSYCSNVLNWYGSTVFYFWKNGTEKMSQLGMICNSWSPHILRYQVLYLIRLRSTLHGDIKGMKIYSRWEEKMVMGIKEKRTIWSWKRVLQVLSGLPKFGVTKKGKYPTIPPPPQGQNWSWNRIITKRMSI